VNRQVTEVPGDRTADIDRSWVEAQDARTLELLKEQLEYVYANSPMYQAKFADAGIEPADITSVADIARLPLTTKAEIREAQQRERPFGDYLAADLTDVVRIHSTSGTTGEAIWEALTQSDLDDIEQSSIASLRASGLEAEDIVTPVMNFCLFMGGYTDARCLEAAGASMIPIGIGNSESLLRAARAMRETGRDIVLFSTPSYATYLAELARSEGLEPKELGIRKGIFGGEYGASDPGFRQKLIDEWGFTSIGDVSGASEVHPLLFSNCSAVDGLHSLTPESVHIELIDPDTEEPVAIEPGVRGELVATHLKRRAQPLVRYRLKDVVQVISAPGELCTCGRRNFRFVYMGRSDDMLVVQGVNFFPDGIWRLLLDRRPQTTGEYLIRLETPPPFEKPLHLVIEHGEEFDGDVEALAEEIRGQIRDEQYVSVRVSVVGPESLPRTALKAKRVYRVYDGDVPEEGGAA
jgi:phenylacetate-CoA ligase